jgi:hypothetical protein
MPKRSLRSWTLSALACWLTLLASADDFNLARLALPPSTSDAGESLPLDDPNTDFTALLRTFHDELPEAGGQVLELLGVDGAAYGLT